MTIKVYFKTMGGHVHTRWFCGRDVDHCGKNGDLVFTVDEWRAVRQALIVGHDSKNVNLVLKEERE